MQFIQCNINEGSAFLQEIDSCGRRYRLHSSQNHAHSKYLQMVYFVLRFIMKHEAHEQGDGGILVYNRLCLFHLLSATVSLVPSIIQCNITLVLLQFVKSFKLRYYDRTCIRILKAPPQPIGQPPLVSLGNSLRIPQSCCFACCTIGMVETSNSSLNHYYHRVSK